jgi:hypothetical protein
LKNTLLPLPRSDFIGSSLGSSLGGSFRESIPASDDHKRSKWGNRLCPNIFRWQFINYFLNQFELMCRHEDFIPNQKFTFTQLI